MKPIKTIKHLTYDITGIQAFDFTAPVKELEESAHAVYNCTAQTRPTHKQIKFHNTKNK